MQLIDLHVHSTASDGTLTPTEVTKLALQCGLTAYALTDHDTVDGVAEAMQAAENTSLTFPVPNFPVLMKEKKSIFWGSI